MRIIALAGSPRKRGNTDILVDAFLEGAEEAGAKTSKVRLNDLDINPCQACYACKKTGKCKQKDDMRRLYKKLVKADAWVFATPVYWWGPSAQLKAALDRMFALCWGDNPKKIEGKKAVLITASEDETEKATPHVAGMMRESFAYMKLTPAGELFIRAYKKGEVAKDKEAVKKARELGKKVAKAG
ncbi:MAG TPA: flavodoxin family protein [bacterium]|nr:flavodoxin family protein [bacterium]